MSRVAIVATPVAFKSVDNILVAVKIPDRLKLLLATLSSCIVATPTTLRPVILALVTVIPVPERFPENCSAVTTSENTADPSGDNVAPTEVGSPTCTPLLAVTRPSESTFVTSSYVIVPPTVRFPVIVAALATIVP